MRIRTLAALVTIIGLVCVGGCAVTGEDPPEGFGTAASSQEDPCTAKDGVFDDWAAVTPCEKANPPRFSAALGAIVKAGATCTGVADDGSCSAVDPGGDANKAPFGWPTGCTTHYECSWRDNNGQWHGCKLWDECCISGFAGDICFSGSFIYL